MAVSFGHLTMIVLNCSVLPGERPSGVFSTSHTILTLTCFLFSPTQFPYLTKYANDPRVLLPPVFSHLLDLFILAVSCHSVVFGKFSSPLGSNAMLCCLRYGWSLDSFAMNLIPLSNSFFKLWYRHSLLNTEIFTAMSLLELIFIRKCQFALPAFAKSQITALITALTIAYTVIS